MASLAPATRTVAAILALSTAAGCAAGTRVAERRAFAAAGLEVRSRQTGQTHEEVLRDFDLFLSRDVEPLGQRAQEEKRRVAAKYRWVYVGGAAAAVAGALLATGGSDGDPFVNTAASVALSVGGLALGVAGGVLAARETGELQGCRDHLARGSEELQAWVVRTFRPTAEPVPPDLWREYVRRTHALTADARCLRVP